MYEISLFRSAGSSHFCRVFTFLHASCVWWWSCRSIAGTCCDNKDRKGRYRQECYTRNVDSHNQKREETVISPSCFL